VCVCVCARAHTHTRATCLPGFPAKLTSQPHAYTILEFLHVGTQLQLTRSTLSRHTLHQGVTSCPKYVHSKETPRSDVSCSPVRSKMELQQRSLLLKKRVTVNGEVTRMRTYIHTYKKPHETNTHQLKVRAGKLPAWSKYETIKRNWSVLMKQKIT
jgi:hypothetical protein